MVMQRWMKRWLESRHCDPKLNNKAGLTQQQALKQANKKGSG